VGHIEQTETHRAPLQRAKPPWANGIVLVCRECDGDGKRLRNRLREAAADAGLRKTVRVVMSGCLDVCPKRATTVVTVSGSGTDCTIVRAGKPSAREVRPLIERFESDTTEQSSPDRTT
jgi:hypothetical protein